MLCGWKLTWLRTSSTLLLECTPGTTRRWVLSPDWWYQQYYDDDDINNIMMMMMISTILWWWWWYQQYYDDDDDDINNIMMMMLTQACITQNNGFQAASSLSTSITLYFAVFLCVCLCVCLCVNDVMIMAALTLEEPSFTFGLVLFCRLSSVNVASIYLHIYLLTYLHIYLLTCLHIYLLTYLHISINLSTYISINLSKYISINLSTYISIMVAATRLQVLPLLCKQFLARWWLFRPAEDLHTFPQLLHIWKDSE